MKLTKKVQVNGKFKQVLDLTKVAIYLTRAVEKLITKHKWPYSVWVNRHFVEYSTVDVTIFFEKEKKKTNTSFTIRDYNTEQDVKETLQSITEILSGQVSPEYYGGER